MHAQGYAPDACTYTTLLNKYVRQLSLRTAPTTASPSTEEEKHSTFFKALSIYFTMNKHSGLQPKGDPNESAPLNTLLELVGVDEALGISDQRIDALQADIYETHCSSHDAAAQWTRLSLAEIRRRFAHQALPWAEFIPGDCVVSQMGPIELLFWRDMAAGDKRPDRVSYNQLIMSLLAAKELSRANQYFRFLVAHCQSFVRLPFLPRRVKLKNEPAAIKQRQEREAQLRRLLAKTPSRASGPIAPAAGPNSLEALTPPGSSHHGQDAPFSDSPLHLRTLCKLGTHYLCAEQYEDVATCYRLALRSYPLSAIKCFGFIFHSWRKRRYAPLLATLHKHSLPIPPSLREITEEEEGKVTK